METVVLLLKFFIQVVQQLQELVGCVPEGVAGVSIFERSIFPVAKVVKEVERKK